MKLAQLARLARADLVGAGDVEVTAVTDLEHAHPHSLVMVADARRLRAAEDSAAGALLVGLEAPATVKPALRAANLRAAFARLLWAFSPPTRIEAGVHPTAVVAPGADIGSGAQIGPQAVVDAGAAIGARTLIGAGSAIGARARIGADCLLYPHVTVYPDSIIGDRVIIHSGAVIGSDGFGYATDEGVHVKIPHLGRAVIEDDVEIGANTTVDRATLGETRIGRGTKVDNLVQVAHNVVIGEGALIVAQVGISGSVTIGAGAIVAGQAGIADHLAIGAGARVLAQGGVTKDVPAGATVSGYPAREHREQLRLEAAIHRLPSLLDRIEALEARVANPSPGRGRRGDRS